MDVSSLRYLFSQRSDEQALTPSPSPTGRGENALTPSPSPMERGEMTPFSLRERVRVRDKGKGT